MGKQDYNDDLDEIKSPSKSDGNSYDDDDDFEKQQEEVKDTNTFFFELVRDYAVDMVTRKNPTQSKKNY